jgi:nitroreductase
MTIPEKLADTSVKIHDLIARRWSTRALDKNHKLTEIEITSLLEAARWSASVNNSQPWKFLVSHRNDKNFKAITSTLSGFNLEWAPNASCIIMVAVQATPVTNVEIFDAGLAVSALCLQAQALELKTHQMAGFDKEKIKEIFSFDESIQPVVLIAIGKITDASYLSPVLQEREVTPRTRKELSEMILKGLS